ncbi:MAG: hypothetical protein NTW14_02750 [bacterium]|nr:hypothetical protein [bacterium]
MQEFSLDFTVCVPKVPELSGPGVVEYECNHCTGLSTIVVVRNDEKFTVPTIEFCPFCGQSNQNPPEELD